MDFIIFLIMVGVISLSGVLMPGPVFAAAVAKGFEHRHAGAWVGLGHLVTEVPLIIAIAAGLNYFFDNQWIKLIVGVVGGILLLFMGVRMFRMRRKPEVVEHAFPMHPFFAGVVTTISNPYYILWWATIGASLIIMALGFGLTGVVLFIIVHESCDLSWDWFVAYTVHRSKKLWTKNIHTYVFGIVGLILIVFGIFFIFAFWLAD